MKAYEFKDWTLKNVLEDKAAKVGGKTYLLVRDQPVSYREMNERTNRVANSFSALGIKKGDKVCTLMQNSPEYILVWFGLAKIGAIMIPINTNLKGTLLQYIINNSDSSTLVMDKGLLPSIKFVEEGIPRITRIIVFSGDDGAPETALSQRFEILGFDHLYQGNPSNPNTQVKPQDPVAIMYTSGTTGPSKGVILSHAHYYLTAAQVNAYMDYREDDVVHTYLPLFHANASTLAMYGTLLAEATLALGRKFSVTNFWDEMRLYKVTKTNLMGSMLLLLWRQPEKPNDRENDVKIINSVPLIPESKAFEQRFDVKLIGMFGTTETSIATALSYAEEVKPTSCGKALDIFDVEIFDENDMLCPRRTPGEIVVRGKISYAQMDGYYKLPEETLKVFRNLWYHTGDFGYKDENGYFYFVDRKKDSIRRRGENISSFEVEVVINSHPSVLESAAIAVPSELSEDDVKIVVILKENHKLTPEELLDYCQDRMAYFAIPRYVEFVKDLPKTPNQKIEKYKLREQGLHAGVWDREKAGYKLKR